MTPSLWRRMYMGCLSGALVPLSGARPEDLLPKPLADYAARLFFRP